MNSYTVINIIHIATAFISIAGFFIRGIWMIQSSSILQQRWVKITPAINDSLLLLSAIALVILTAQFPGPVAWINAKILALILYIVLGIIALKRGKTREIRITAWCLALLTYAYITMVALNKNVLPF